MRRTGLIEGSEPRATSVAIAWLAHPASLASIALLLLNDHVLKAHFGSWWTGKLSDVAGLVFAPALVAVLAAYGRPSTRPRAVAAASLAAVGVLFALAKATPGGAALASDLWPSIGGPGLIRADATDLLALPALGFAWLSFRRAHRHPASGEGTRRFRSLLLIPAVVAVAATSSMPEVFATSVATRDGQLLVFMGNGDWAASSDGFTFAWVSLDAEPEELTVACVPSDPGVCYRAAVDPWAIQATRDGGETWVAQWPGSRVWEVSTSWASNTDRDFLPVAVLETADSYQVFVVTGEDGIAVRAPDGTWTFERGDASDGVLSPPRVPPGHMSNVNADIAASFSAFLLTLIILGLIARDRGEGWGARRVFAWIPVTLAGLVAAWMLLLVPEPRPTWDLGPGGDLVSPIVGIVGVIILASILMVLGFHTAIPTRDDAVPQVIGWAALVGAAAGLARAVPMPLFLPLWSRIPIVAAVAGAALALAIVRGPRWRPRNGSPPGPDPLVWLSGGNGA